MVAGGGWGEGGGLGVFLSVGGGGEVKYQKMGWREGWRRASVKLRWKVSFQQVGCVEIKSRQAKSTGSCHEFSELL